MSGDKPNVPPVNPVSSGAAKANVSLGDLSPEDVGLLKDELLKAIALRAGDPTVAAHSNHGNVHSSNSNADLLANIGKLDPADLLKGGPLKNE